MRKGQFQHVFTFLMLILIAGVVLLLGYRFIAGLLDQGCEVELLELREDLERDLRAYASYGSYQEPSYPAACGARALCLIAGDAWQDADGDGSLDDDPAASYPGNSAIEAELRYPSRPEPNNLFLLYGDRTEPLGLWAERVRLDDGKVLCVEEAGGRFRLGAEGKGRTVIISDES